MTHPIDILHEARKLRLLAAALELPHFTSGAPAQMEQLVPKVRDQVLVEARDACERVLEECRERDAHTSGPLSASSRRAAPAIASRQSKRCA